MDLKAFVEENERVQTMQPKIDTTEPIDKATYHKLKQQELLDLYNLQEAAVGFVYSGGEEFKAYLDIQANMPRHTPSNCLLILAQKPEAIDLRSFDEWQKVGRSIKRGEKGISIVSSKKYKKEDEEHRQFISIKAFDVSQTFGKELAVKPTKSITEKLNALIKVMPQKIDVHGIPDNEQQAFTQLSRDIAKSIFVAKAADGKDEDLEAKIFLASYLLCKRYGIETEGFDFERMVDEISLDNDPDIADLRDLLGESKDLANKLASKIDAHLYPQKNKDVSR